MNSVFCKYNILIHSSVSFLLLSNIHIAYTQRRSYTRALAWATGILAQAKEILTETEIIASYNYGPVKMHLE